jgi:short subunit dehydrogenase-like uncharacterized protein
MADKQFQIVVLGASGFVGKLVAKHLAQDYVVGRPLEKQLPDLHAVQQTYCCCFASTPNMQRLNTSSGLYAAQSQISWRNAGKVKHQMGYGCQEQVQA